MGRKDLARHREEIKSRLRTQDGRRMREARDERNEDFKAAVRQQAAEDAKNGVAVERRFALNFYL